VAELSDVEAAEVRVLVAREQFVIESTSADFGEQQVWERGGVLVRLTRDRRQWSCELSRRGWRDWFDVDLVAAAFGSKSDGPAERIADVIDKFADDRMLQPLTAFRDDHRLLQALGGVTFAAGRLSEPAAD
jgi:hypothetical protein